MKKISTPKLTLSELSHNLTKKLKFPSLNRYACGRPISSEHIQLMDYDGNLGFHGLASCKSIASCPSCRHAILSRRQEQLEFVNKFWLEDHDFDLKKVEALSGKKKYDLSEGFKLFKKEKVKRNILLVTFTVPHYRHYSLKRLLGKIDDKTGMRYARHIMFRSYEWLNKTPWLEGYVSGIENTWGYENGHHPHYHFLMYVDEIKMPRHFFDEKGKLDKSAIGDFFYNMWPWACQKVGLDIPDREHGVKVEYGRNAGKYLAKWSSANELTSQHAKESLKEGHFTMAELEQLVAQGRADKHQIKALEEYYRVFHGVKILTYSEKVNLIREFYKSLSGKQKSKTLGQIKKESYKAIKNAGQIPLLRKLYKRGGRRMLDLFLDKRHDAKLGTVLDFPDRVPGKDQLARIRLKNELMQGLMGQPVPV